MSPLGWKGSWASPGQLLKGSGTVLGFTPGWGGLVNSPWAEKEVVIAHLEIWKS